MAYPFVQARNYTPANRTRSDIHFIVFHDMEVPGETRRGGERRPLVRGPYGPGGVGTLLR